MNIEEQLYTHILKVLSSPKEITCYLKEYKIESSIVLKISDNNYITYPIILNLPVNLNTSNQLKLNTIKEKIREEIKQHPEFNTLIQQICCGILSITAIYNNNATVKEHGYLLIEFDEPITDYLRKLVINDFENYFINK